MQDAIFSRRLAIMEVGIFKRGFLGLIKILGREKKSNISRNQIQLTETCNGGMTLYSLTIKLNLKKKKKL